MNVNLSKKESRDVNYEDQVEVREVDQNHVLIQKGTLCYNGGFIIPMYLAEKYYGNTFWFSIDQEEKNSYMINSGHLSNLVKV
jgi:hypothetical protein